MRRRRVRRSRRAGVDRGVGNHAEDLGGLRMAVGIVARHERAAIGQQRRRRPWPGEAHVGGPGPGIGDQVVDERPSVRRGDPADGEDAPAWQLRHADGTGRRQARGRGELGPGPRSRHVALDDRVGLDDEDRAVAELDRHLPMGSVMQWPSCAPRSADRVVEPGARRRRNRVAGVVVLAPGSENASVIEQRHREVVDVADAPRRRPGAAHRVVDLGAIQTPERVSRIRVRDPPPGDEHTAVGERCRGVVDAGGVHRTGR